MTRGGMAGCAAYPYATSGAGIAAGVLLCEADTLRVSEGYGYS